MEAHDWVSRWGQVRLVRGTEEKSLRARLVNALPLGMSPCGKEANHGDSCISIKCHFSAATEENACVRIQHISHATQQVH